MKAIIIDDERHVREGLLLLADWERFGIVTILEAEDGEQAKSLITEHRPEIIFTDMRMPRLDGINLLKWLHSSDIKSKTIVVSGYDDFDYMRNAIHYNSFDYILKPIEPDILNETLEKAVNEWKEQARTRKFLVNENRVVNEVKPLYWDRLFSTLCRTDSNSEAAVEKIRTEYEVPFLQVQKTIALIRIKPIVMKSFHGDEDLAFFTVTNIGNELLRKNNDGVCFRNIHKDGELVILFWNDKNIAYLLDQVYSLIYQFSKVCTSVALGKPSRNILEAYSSALEGYMRHDLTKVEKIIASETESRPLLHLLDYSNELKWAIKTGNPAGVESRLQEIFHTLESHHTLSLEQIDVWENQFEILRNNWLKEYKIESSSPFSPGTDYWREDGTVSFRRFKEEKIREFNELVEALTSMKYQKEKTNMQQIEEYLQQHYQEDVTLQEIADTFFLSREYISRKFKQEYKHTVIDYLTHIRLDKAMKLLENPYLKIYEVAYGVGYGNEKYFSKVFKKQVGMTPNEYRQSLSTKS
ncbi:response regulator [Rossellomorea aquimaris]|uniref:response regulator transcription factor n=1 Tax=Rossellomorea aquimaris TaxID=189382 RepID=UPI001CD3A8F9|nr:response regulator [Rossellomorea aquimaris]MCA1056590.1 response regulator [Rossellomorea aquimaris]